MKIERPETNIACTIVDSQRCGEQPKATASIMMDILAQNYGTHNLTSNIEPLTKDIQTGRVRAFLALKPGDSVFACAALIQLNEHDVEIGRGACIPNSGGGGGMPLLKAAESWEKGIDFPETSMLRAEVRTAKSTKEVPDGIATQVLCLNKIGLSPTGFAPLFHHGEPNRQEMFLLASMHRNNIKTNRDFPKIPKNIFSSNQELYMFNQFWADYFGQNPKLLDSILSIDTDAVSFSPKKEGPLFVLRPDGDLKKNNLPNRINREFSEGTRFSLVKIPLTNDFLNIASQVELVKGINFKLVGFEPVIRDGVINVDILFGRLSKEGKERLILPSFTENIFSHDLEDVLTLLSIGWRK